MKNNQYFVYLFKKGFYFVEKSQSVTIPGFEEFDFFIHRPVIDIINKEIQMSDKDWVITEGQTGLVITSYARQTKKQLLEVAKQRLDHFGKTVFQSTIETSIKTYGLSPRYGGIITGIEQISILDYVQEFKNIFRVSLYNYLDILKAFDIIKFDEQFIKPKEGQSTKEKILETYGQNGVDLIEKLLDVHIEV